ncbi:MAG TPA: xanthine dehydrogenase family protein molybdopterin-binding subunit [Streptosporangiaceae bacterium]|nr:xanthine dehydrogenase family protein molybdopterin-binding subunit [Streptosporangiaceae bacterium]
MTAIAAERYTGASIKRSEDPRILTGTGRYVDDIKLPGMLHAAFVRSPMAHARVLSVDVSAALELPGVVAVLTGADLDAMTDPAPDPLLALLGGDGPTPEFTLLATDKVRLVGDPVAIVIAESRYLAEDGCELVEVDYEDLPAVMNAAFALDPGSPVLFANLGDNVSRPHSRKEFGDVAGTFAGADRVMDFHIDVHRHQNVPMEGRGCVASYDPDLGVMTVYAATQSVHITRNGVAARLGMAPDQVRVLAGDIGGSFGLKIGASREEQAVAAASRHLGRPVKWVEDRGENLTVSGQAREESFDVRAAISNDGDLLGLDVAMVIDTGAYPGLGTMVPSIIEGMLPGPYKLAALGFESTGAITNKATYVAYRGPWASETFIRERILDLIASELGMDPIGIRLRNVAPRTVPPAMMITGRPLAGVTTAESLERVAALVDVGAFRRRQALARSQGRYLGIGVATFIEAAPGPRSGPDAALGHESMRLLLDEDGIVVMFTGQMPHGQSHQTTLAQIAADEFGVPFSQVRVVVGDSSVVPFGLTGGSRSATMTGGVALHGARQLKAKVLDFASVLMEVSARDLVITDGNVWVRGDPATAIPVREVARRAAAASASAAAASSSSSSGSDSLGDGVDARLEVEATYDGGAGGWSGGTHCAIVEVDVETGLVAVQRYIAVEDCGALINPAVVEGQIRGGIAQGIGAVLLERSAYGEDGSFQSATFMDYLMPTACDVPRIEIEHLETVPLDAHVNFRGVGEGGMIVAPPTLVNAIEDALAPFGVRIYEQHLPPARILELIASADPGR